jgi:hypothetical protein
MRSAVAVDGRDGANTGTTALLVQSMDALVPPDVTAELTQILSNLVLGDNEIRSKYVFMIPSLSHPVLHLTQCRGRCRRAPGPQTRRLSPRPHPVCHKSGHRRSGTSCSHVCARVVLIAP